MSTKYRPDQFSQEYPTDDVPEYRSAWDDAEDTPAVAPVVTPVPVPPVVEALARIVAAKAVAVVPVAVTPVVEKPVARESVKRTSAEIRSAQNARYYAKHGEAKRARMREYQAGRRKLGTLARAGESPEG